MLSIRWISRAGGFRLLLALWIGFCLLWVASAPRPWMTRAFAEGGVRQVPVKEYAVAGLWIGLLISGVLAVALLLLYRWWGAADAVPVRPSAPGAKAKSWPAWAFHLAVLGIVAFAIQQRIPAMTLSFWGDEGWMFCDFVHGKWQATSKGSSIQEYLRFNRVDWMQAFFGDQSGNNHWLATLLQRIVLKTWQVLGGHPEWSFREWVIRLVPLAGGVGSLVLLAGWIRWMGRPVTALVATAFMALHPWHVRFSVEARGYSLMLCFFILTLWALMLALKHGRKRDWILVGLAQFLMMYSWKGGVYALVLVNLVVAVRLLWGPMPDPARRRVAVVRWMAAGLLGAMFFIPLAMPSQLQMRKSIEEVRRRAKPMEAEWRKNAVAETLTGIPWVEQDAQNPREVSLERLARQQRWTWPAVLVLILIFLIGLVRLWRQDRLLAAMCLAVLVSGVIAAWHFKHGLRVELLTWYLLYNIPILSLLAAVAVTPGPVRVPAWQPSPQRPWPRPVAWIGAGSLLLGGMAALGAPMIKDLQRYPRENLKRAWKMTRGAHEPRGYDRPSKIYTGWLWRHTFAYEPRGDMYVRTRETLYAKMELARKNDGEFYMIVGIRELCEMICGDVMKELRDPSKFEHLGTLWGVESLNTLDVYKMKKPLPPAAP